MRDLMTYVNRCMRELDRIGVPYGIVDHWEINTRAKHRWGLCSYNHIPNHYTISISSRLLDESNDEKGLINTIIHELLHTCKDCMCHAGKWKMWADTVNAHYGYNIKRCSSQKEKGICESNIIKHTTEFNYVVECPHCHTQWKRQKMSKIIQYPSYYSCGICHTTLIRVK